MQMSNFNTRFDSYVARINDELKKYVCTDFFGDDSKGLLKMLEAVSYSLENGGKRIRPVLTLEFCRICSENGDFTAALPFACAVEMIHTYSLIHDDLPCMDDDDLRRGKPSNHKVFGYANALLAGDALQTLAFETLLSADTSAEITVAAGRELSRAAGIAGMVAGQTMDLANENTTVSLDEITRTDVLKTGCLIRTAAKLGCIAGGQLSGEYIQAADKYASCIGLAFQIIDDILDVTSNNETLGKPVGSDGEKLKSTYVSHLGLDGARQEADRLTKEAVCALSVFGDKAAFLIELTDKLLKRKK